MATPMRWRPCIRAWTCAPTTDTSSLFHASERAATVPILLAPDRRASGRPGAVGRNVLGRGAPSPDGQSDSRVDLSHRQNRAGAVVSVVVLHPAQFHLRFPR